MDLVAPVFQIHNSSTSIGFLNEVNIWTFEDEPLGVEDDEETDLEAGIALDFSDEQALVNSPVQLVNRLDILLACGQLSDGTKTIITNAISQLDDNADKLDMALYLILISPEYAVLK